MSAPAGALLIYGANGYTGHLVAREAAARGLAPVLAGRRAAQLSALAGELRLPHRVFGLEHPATLDAGLSGVAAVLHCAGPFADTSAPMAEACLRTGTHYVDITGELSVFEALAARSGAARAAGVTLLPGAGFDVVPSDALAATLAAALPGATRLELAFLALGGISHGTALTLARNLGAPGAECRGGRLVSVPIGARRRDVDFGRGPVPCVSLPWGDVLTAHASTGIADITAYGAVTPGVRRALAFRPAARALGALASLAPVQRLLVRRLTRGQPGPTEAQRAAGRGLFWGEASDAAGARVSGLLATPEGYSFTAVSAVAIARRVMEGGVPAGFQTPSRACGARWLLALPGISGLAGVVADCRG